MFPLGDYRMKQILMITLILLSLVASTFMLTSCDDDDDKPSSTKEETSNYDMLGTWYAEKKWSIPTQYDYDGFDTYVLKEWHSFEANGVLRVRNSFYLKPREASENLVPIKENPWVNEPCEWLIKGKVLTWIYSNETITKNIVHDTYMDTTSVNGSLIEMIYTKQK